MARDTTEFAHQSGERAMQAATFGMNWAREFAEQSFGQGKLALDGFMRVSRKMAEDFENQAAALREHTTAVAEKSFANTFEFGQRLASVKEPHEFAQVQSEFMARQAQMVADQTRDFTQRVEKAAQEFSRTAQSAMSEAQRRTEDGQNIPLAASQRAERRQRAEA